jgi:DNA-binding transcriptional regulator YiaG
MTPAEIRAARETLGLTQGEFARVMGVNGPAYVSAWEAGTRRPTGPAVRLMRAYLSGYRPDDWQHTKA